MAVAQALLLGCCPLLFNLAVIFVEGVLVRCCFWCLVSCRVQCCVLSGLCSLVSLLLTTELPDT